MTTDPQSPLRRQTTLSSHQDKPTGGGHGGHGHSLAAWVAVAVMLVGFAVMSFAVVGTSVAWFVGGVVVTVFGAVLGKVLSAMGFGAGGRDEGGGVR